MDSGIKWCVLAYLLFSQSYANEEECVGVCLANYTSQVATYIEVERDECKAEYYGVRQVRCTLVLRYICVMENTIGYVCVDIQSASNTIVRVEN